MKIKTIIFAACCVVFITMQSCSVEKRAQRHLRKAIKLDSSIKKKDTLRITDTILTKEIQNDTVVSLESITDTLFINKGKLSMKLIRVRDSVYLSGKCATDTIYFDKEIIVEKLIQKKYPKPLQKIIDWWWLFLIGGLFFMYLLARILNK